MTTVKMIYVRHQLFQSGRRVSSYRDDGAARRSVRAHTAGVVPLDSGQPGPRHCGCASIHFRNAARGEPTQVAVLI
jgi:hypothetical protein